ncbi:DUF488 domain-containing protein [Rhodovibrio salinarum]|uniref:DUF488 domain-containing protein n=1 Tax=Rhodovibrio salinarum TaxID=1087 RepID=A0A934UZR3_9PROT|nr:DUF488 domain-containing protein [Rhodovibrio salinarum]MBK1697018.1 DUF488 domain-containing protein [Rhodovibrio salinarum]
MPTLYTLGHSNHESATVLGLLRQHGVDLLVDVRTVPYSKRHPQFRKHALESACREAGIDYRWRGEQLGGIKRDSACRTFDEAAGRPGFVEALGELVTLARAQVPALMCAEKEPMACHRTALVCRHLAARPDARDLAIWHIRADGSLEDHRTFERRLVAEMGIDAQDLFAGDPVQDAYDALSVKMTGAR